MSSLEQLIEGLTFHKVDFAPDGGDSDDADWGREEVASQADANVVSSRIPNGTLHKVLLDLDVAAYLVPSTTTGHSHLYADVVCSWDDYARFLDAAVKIGLIEPGYAGAAKARGYSSLRLPGVQKTLSVTVRPCPECAQGKHGNCTIDVLGDDLDVVPCPCAEKGHES